MAFFRGPNIAKNGLVLYYDKNNRKSYNGSTDAMKDLSGVTNLPVVTSTVSNSSGLSWANNITSITISLLMEKLGTTTNYAYHPVSKWDGDLTKTSFVLYHFGNYLGNGQDGVLGWYAGAGYVWQQIVPYGFGTMVTGNIWHIVLQYNSVSGGQGWINGAKASTRIGAGTLGTGGSASDIVVYGPDGSGNSLVHQIMFYNRELSDAEIINLYQQYYKPRIRT